MGPKYLFVYGTLRRGGDARLRDLLSSRCEFVGTGTVQGRLYEVDGYPGMVETGGRGDRVLGELYRVTPGVPILDELDRYEECSQDFPEPHEYRRKELPVQTPDGRVTQAWVYVYNRPTDRLERIESGDYADCT